MKQGWESKRIEDCFKLKSGDGLTSKMMSEDGIYPVFGGNGIAGLHNKFNLSGSNVIIGRVGALCGNVRHMNEKIWLTDNAFRIVDFKYDFDHSFLTYLLNFKNLREFARQAAQPVISNSSLKDVTLEFPKSLSEQQRIVTILDEAFTAIAIAKANAEQNLKNAKELFESYLQGVFENKGEDWEEKTLGEIADVEYGFTDKSTEEGDFRYIRITDIDKNGELILEDKKYINHSIEAEGFLIRDNDLLMARTGATFAKVLLYTGDEPSVFASYLIRIKFNEKIENALYWYFTKTKYYWEQANSLQSGAAQPHFNGAAVKQVIFSYPKSTKEQKVLIGKFETLSVETKKLEAIYQQKINDLEELKKSVLQKAFSGELKTDELCV